MCNRKKMMGRNVNPGLTEPKENRPDILPDLLKNLVGPPGFEPRTQGL